MNKLSAIIEELIQLTDENNKADVEKIKILISRAFIEGINFSEKNSVEKIDNCNS